MEGQRLSAGRENGPHALFTIEEDVHSVSSCRCLVPKVEETGFHPLPYLRLEERLPVPILRLRDPIELGEVAVDLHDRVGIIDAVHGAAKAKVRKGEEEWRGGVEGTYSQSVFGGRSAFGGRTGMADGYV